jgi:hypothetical protein
MKELLEQYKRIQGMKECLRSFNKYVPDMISDKAIDVMIDRIDLKLDSLAREIVRLIQDNPPEDIPQPERKPLWAVIAAGEPDSEARARGIMGSTKYRVYFSKQDALESIGDSIDKKVVPVWGE